MSVDGTKPDEKVIREAALIIKRGGVAAYPTESFYGLGVDPMREDAVDRLYQIKQRQRGRPILVLIPSIEALNALVGSIPVLARVLMDAFWPGGLTLVFDASTRVPDTITGGTGKIGIRVSSHPVAAALTRILHGPVTGTSANLSGRPACRSGDEVMRQLGRQVDVIIDSGGTTGKEASTVLDVSVNPLRILRQGMISQEQIESAVSEHISPF